MKKIGMVTQKGGAGKSTSAIALAGALAQKHRVALVDLDPQRSCVKWSSIATLPASLEVFGADSVADLKHLKGFDFVVIDTAGKLAADVLPHLDLALLPSAPSVFDVWAVADSVELIKAHQQHRPGLKAALFVNKLKANTRLGKEVTEALNGLGIDVLDVTLGDRAAYPTAIAEGKTAVTSGDSTTRLEALRFSAAVTKYLEEAV